MTKSRHSYIAFYTSDWIAGVSNLTRPLRSVYMDICLYNWDKAKPMPLSQFKIAVMDLTPQESGAMLEMLIDAEKIVQDENGALTCVRALEEGRKAYDLWFKKSQGGKKARGSLNNDSLDESPTESEAEPYPYPDLVESTASTKGSGSKNLQNLDSSGPKPILPEYDEQERKAAPVNLSAVNLVSNKWNQMAVENGLPPIPSSTDKRKKEIHDIIAVHGIDDILAVIATIPESEFLLGKNDRMGPAKFDWSMKNFDRIAAGEFHDVKPEAPPPVKLVAEKTHPAEDGHGKIVRAFLIDRIGEDRFASIYRGIQFHKKDSQLVIAAISSGIAQDLVIRNQIDLDAAATLCGASSVTHASISLVNRKTPEPEKAPETAKVD